MSVPFSNTHLRIPRGFGTILEGLTREVLRDQPENIPKYAARYFDSLLKQREESGMDPAEWAARLEDRFYNNHTFKATGASPEKEPAPEVAIFKEKSQTEDESSHAREASSLSTTQPNVSEEVDSAESTEEENPDVTDKHIISVEKGISEEEFTNRRPAADIQSDVLSGTEEEKDPAINTHDKVDWAANEKDNRSVPDEDVCQSELESDNLPSFSGVSSIDVCAQELRMTEDEVGNKQDSAVVDKQTSDSEGEENTKVEEPVEALPYSGLADVDICTTELGGTVRAMEISNDNDIHVVEEESLKSQHEETPQQSPLSQFETPEHNQEETEDQTEKTKGEEETETEASSGEKHESLAHIESCLNSNAIPKEDSLVEISFEDVPEAQQITEVGEKQPEEEGSVEVLQTKILELQQEEESIYVTAVATDQNISSPQHHEQSEREGVEKDFPSEGEEMESRRKAWDMMKEKVVTNYSNLNNSDDGDDDSDDHEKAEGVSSSHQPTTEAAEENPEEETDHTNDDNEKLTEGELCQNEDSEKEIKSNDTDFKEDETFGRDKEDIHTEGYSETEEEDLNYVDVENHSSLVTQSNTSAAAMEAGNETLEASAQHFPEDSQRARAESRLEDTIEEKEVTPNEADKVAEEEKADSDVQKSDAMCEKESISLTHSGDRTAADHEGEERPLLSKKDTTDPGVRSSDKQEECSRPQEEEDIMDIPLDDPEANRAAAKIQAGFRGHMTRKKMKPEDKAEGEEVSSTGDVLNGSQGDTEAGGSGTVERDDTSVPEQ